MDTFNRLLNQIIPVSFILPKIHNDIIMISILKYKHDLAQEISLQTSLTKSEIKRQLIELNRKTTFYCVEISNCVYDKIDVFDKITKEHIHNAIISYFNDIIPNSFFFFENIINDENVSFGGRENEYMLYTYLKFPVLYLNIKSLSFITNLGNLNNIFDSYIEDYSLLYEFIITKPSFKDKKTNDIKDIFLNNNLTVDIITLLIESISEFINTNIVVILQNGNFLINKPISADKLTVFVYLQMNEFGSNYWAIIKSMNLNNNSVSNYTINDLKIPIVNNMIDNCFNKEPISIYPSDQDFTEPLKKIEIDVEGKKIVVLIGKTGILYKPVSNEILGIIEIIDGEIIPSQTGVCNIQWIKEYTNLLS
jgi:hypothetical protein